MSTDVLVEEFIARPRETVAAYMFDPRNDADWTTGVIACRPLTEGPLRVGSRVERTARFLGREFAYTYDVVDADPEGIRFVVMTVEKPFPMHIRYELRDADGNGTNVSIRAKGDAKGFFKFAAPLMNGMVRKNIAADLALLKKRVESLRAA